MTSTSRDGRSIDWAEALALHERALRLTILSRVRDRHAADEVMQEVALAAVAQRSPIRDPGRLGAWLRQLAVRQALLYRRGRGRRLRLIERHAGRMPARDGSSGEADPLDWLLGTERLEQVREALGRLPPRDAEVMLLRYVEGWGYRAMADHLGLTTSAVEARLHRARGRMRGELAANRAIEVPE